MPALFLDVPSARILETLLSLGAGGSPEPQDMS